MNDDNKKRRRGLGKGLSALLPQAPETTESSSLYAEDEESRSFAYISIDKIVPAQDQPRKNFDPESLNELAASIRESGLIQPLVVRKKDDVYELIAGERRWRASNLAELKEVPVVIKDLTDEVAFTLALVENVQREDLSPLEQASAYQRLIDDFGFTQQRVSEAVGKSRSAVANSLRLLRLPKRVLELIESGELSAGHARALVTLPDEESVELAEIIVRHGYSVRDAEEMARDFSEHGSWVKRLDGTQPNFDGEGRLLRMPMRLLGNEEFLSPSYDLLFDGDENPLDRPSSDVKVVATPTGGVVAQKTGYRDNPQIRFLTEKLAERLGTRVAVQDRGGHGRVVVHYDNLEILQDVLDRILGPENNENFELE